MHLFISHVDCVGDFCCFQMSLSVNESFHGKDWCDTFP